MRYMMCRVERATFVVLIDDGLKMENICIKFLK